MSITLCLRRGFSRFQGLIYGFPKTPYSYLNLFTIVNRLKMIMLKIILIAMGFFAGWKCEGRVNRLLHKIQRI